MRMIRKFLEAITWLFSRNVLNAINNGATYEEVEQIVKSEVDGNV